MREFLRNKVIYLLNSLLQQRNVRKLVNARPTQMCLLILKPKLAEFKKYRLTKNAGRLNPNGEVQKHN